MSLVIRMRLAFTCTRTYMYSLDTDTKTDSHDNKDLMYRMSRTCSLNKTVKTTHQGDEFDVLTVQSGSAVRRSIIKIRFKAPDQSA